jgi:hypothetical protein
MLIINLNQPYLSMENVSLVKTIVKIVQHLDNYYVIFVFGVITLLKIQLQQLAQNVKLINVKLVLVKLLVLIAG